jgi:structural maintenance of chromosome 2
VEKDLKKEEKSSDKLSKQRETSSTKIDNIKSEISSISFSPSEFDQLETEKVDLETTIGNTQDLVDTLTAQLKGRLSFAYSDPVKGFDRSKVKGIVANLIKVKNSEHATALEVVAGGKLFQVVVDEAITGKALLNRGNLKRRVTIIPLDKIKSKGITNAANNTARSMASRMETMASPAIELVGFDEEVRGALEYVFGSTLIVDGTEAANRICDATKTRTVTLDGDVYDPSGTISGGSKNNLGTTLAKLTELTDSSKTLDEAKQRLTEINRQLKQLSTSSKKYEKLNAQLEISCAELASIEKHLSQTTYGMLLKKFNNMQEEINEASNQAEEMSLEKERKWSLHNDLKEKETELTLNREEKLKDIEQKVTKAKQMALEKANQARKVRSSDFRRHFYCFRVH